MHCNVAKESGNYYEVFAPCKLSETKQSVYHMKQFSPKLHEPHEPGHCIEDQGSGMIL